MEEFLEDRQQRYREAPPAEEPGSDMEFDDAELAGPEG